MKDQADELRKMMGSRDKRRQRVIAISSGKGGVGKTNISINLAIALHELMQNVLIIDADLGLANVNVILGSTPKYSLYHVIKGEKRLSEVILETPYGVRYIAGASGFSQLANLSGRALGRLVQGIDFLNDTDIIIVDTGAGISDTVLSFILAADETLIITTPEPTAMIDAYGIIKSIASENRNLVVKLVVNRVKNSAEGRKVSERIISISKKFLDVEVEYLGFIFDDKVVPYAVTRQVPFYAYDNKSRASLCLDYLAKRLISLEYPESSESKGLGGFFDAILAFAKK